MNDEVPDYICEHCGEELCAECGHCRNSDCPIHACGHPPELGYLVDYAEFDDDEETPSEES